MLKKVFKYNINDILKHKDITLKFEKKLTINDKIVDIIVKGFKKNENHELILKRSKALIKFYPNLDDNNHVKKFGKCFKILSGENYQMEQIETNHSTLWEKCIPILTENILQLLDKDENISNLCKRINMSGDEIFDTLNDFYSVIAKKNMNINSSLMKIIISLMNYTLLMK